MKATLRIFSRMELHQNWRINYVKSPRLEVSPHGPGPKLGPFFFEAKKDPGRLKPGLSGTPCHRSRAQGEQAPQRYDCRAYLIRPNEKIPGVLGGRDKK